MLKNLFYLFLTFFISACVSSYQYSYNFPLSSEMISSKDGSLSGFLPQGWFVPNDNVQSPNYLFWLVNEDYSGSITVEEIFVDKQTEQKIKKDGLILLANINIALKKDISRDFKLSRKPEVFRMMNKDYCGYEYYNDWTSRKIRVIIFELNGRFYECSAVPLSGVWFEKDLINLYSAAQTFIFSLTKFS